MARCLAAAVSQAPGLSGMPDAGHCSSAATSASCASSSAKPTSRTMRAIPAVILGDSILQTAWIVRWLSADVTVTHHTLRCARKSLTGGSLLRHGEHLADLGL